MTLPYIASKGADTRNAKRNARPNARPHARPNATHTVYHVLSRSRTPLECFPKRFATLFGKHCFIQSQASGQVRVWVKLNNFRKRGKEQVNESANENADNTETDWEGIKV